MLFNCFNCGKTISTKRDFCVYCKTSVVEFVMEMKKGKTTLNVKEKYAGTLLSFLLKAKTNR